MEQWPCAYCGRKRCKCNYEEGHGDALFSTIESTSAQSTIGGMRASLESMLADLDDDTPATWSISYTLIEAEAEQEPSRKPAKPKVVTMPGARAARVPKAGRTTA
jgi:hypothetical protein